jgi:hypothetical protein
MKQFLFISFFILPFSLFAQVSFQYETRSFIELGLTTNEQIAKYLQIELSDLLPIFQHNSMGGRGTSLSPADLYNIVSSVLQTRDFMTLQRIAKAFDISLERFFLVFNQEIGELSEADLQMTLAVIRIGEKWGVISP